MRLLVTGCNHRSAPVALREQLAFAESEVREALLTLRARYPQAEAVLVSTCNRVELYVARPVQTQPGIGELVEFLSQYHGPLGDAMLSEIFYSREDVDAVRHLFRVCSSLDSMVLGESEILGQARRAFDTARQAGTTGRVLGELFPQAFGVAKEIHTRTAIATGRVSVASTAVDLARQVFSRFDDKCALMVGVGKMGEQTVRHLLGGRLGRLLLTNRTASRAVELAERLRTEHDVSIEVVPFEAWADRLPEADIVITGTGARSPILTKELYASVPARRRYRPQLIVDIAVPRDVAAGVGEVEGVYLYNIDDLQSVTESALVGRREAIAQCQQIIEEAVLVYARRESSQEFGPVVAALRQRLNQIGEGELAWLLPKLKEADAHDRALIQQVLHRVMQKILHEPTQALRSQPANGAGRVYADSLRVLFDLNVEAQPTDPKHPEDG